MSRSKIVYSHFFVILIIITFFQISLHAQIFQKVTNSIIVSDSPPSSTAGWIDYNNDNFLDLFVAREEFLPNLLFKNLGDGTFIKIIDGDIVNDLDKTRGQTWGDINNDYFVDLYITNQGNNSFYLNDGDSTFTKVISGQFVNNNDNSDGCCWGDYNNDSYLDLFVANRGLNCLYKNNGDGTFEKIPTGSIVNEYNESVSCSWADYDNDGDLDIFVANTAYENNDLFLNNNDGTFTKTISGTIVTDGENSTGCSWGDYDNDGDLDLFVANFGQNNFLYNNNGDGTFSKITSGVLVNDGGYSRGGSWGDYDNDGYLDLFVVNGNGQNNCLYHNNGNGTFAKITSEIVAQEGGNGTSGVFADFDNDGDLDLFVTNADRGNFFYLNNGNSNNFLNIKCVGTSYCNSSAVGTKVSIKSNFVWQTAEIITQTGTRGSQNSLNAEFGLGTATIVDSIIVEWPAAQTNQIFTNVAANQFLIIYEPIVPIITNILPIKAYQGLTSNITITGKNTHFSDSTGILNVWLEKGANTIDATNFAAQSNTLLNADFYIPVSSDTGLWDLVIETTIDSVIKSADAIKIFPEPPVIQISPDSIHFSLETGLTDSASFTIANIGNDTLTFSLSDETIRGEYKKSRSVDRSYLRSEFNVQLTKGQQDWRVGQSPSDGSGGPDLFGYKWIDSDEPGGPVFNWIDISGTGTPVTGLGDDDFIGPFPIGFTFSYYGQEYSEFYICSNGFLGFGPNTSGYSSLSNSQIPNTFEPNNILPWMWYDLNPSAGGSIFYETLGDRLIVQFVELPEFGSPGTVTAQVIINTSGSILYQYLAFQNGIYTSYCTVGIENYNGSDGLQVLFNSSGYLHDNLAIMFNYGADWLSEKPLSGNIPPNSSMDIKAIIDADGLFGGNYQAWVVANSNDPINPQVKLPKISLDVTGIPIISVSPKPLLFDTTFVGASLELQINNAGTDTLIVSNIVSTNQIFTIDTTSLLISPLSGYPLQVVFDPLVPGEYEGWIIVESNDTQNPLDSTFVRGVAVEAPVAVVTPTFNNPVSVLLGDSTDVVIEIGNSGGTALEWTARVTRAPVSPLEKNCTPVGQAKRSATVEEAPVLLENPSLPFPAPWDLQFGYSLPSVGNAGSEFDGEYFYITKWASNYIDKYDVNGNFIEEFSIPGVNGLRDLAFDGTYMYGGAAGNTIYEMDFTTQTLVGTIASPVAVRHIAYDERYDAFWVGNWSTDIALIDRNGTTLSTIPSYSLGLVGLYGSAYDNWSEGGPYLWAFDQGMGPGTPQYIYQIDLNTGMLTGFAYDVSVDFPQSFGIAGGLFACEGIVPDKATIGGVLQGTPDILFGYELADVGLSWISLLTESGIVEPGGQADLTFRMHGTEQDGDTAYVVIYTNDPMAPVVNVEVIRDVVVGINQPGNVPTIFDLKQNYPNPFNPNTTIKYQLPKASEVELQIFNILGQRVKTLVKGKVQTGYYETVWDGRNDLGQQAASGIYIYRFKAADYQKTLKLILLK